MNRSKVEEVLAKLKKLQEAWCADEVDDPEDLMNDIPEFIDYAVDALTEALAA
jgi:hypothetical protein